MMAHQEGDRIVLSTGKKIYANCGYVGINAEGELSEGYDGCPLDGDFEEGYAQAPGDQQLTPADLAELADYMLGLWQRFKERAATE